jgi:hypothetical protein
MCRDIANLGLSVVMMVDMLGVTPGGVTTVATPYRCPGWVLGG